MVLLSTCLVFLFLVKFSVVHGVVSDAEYARMPSLFLEDNYDKCMQDKANSLYCSFSYWLEPKNPANPPKIWTTIKAVSEIESNYRHDHLRHRICVRETCPNVDLRSQNIAQQIDECYDEKFESKGLKGNVTDLKCVDAFTKYPIEVFDLVVGLFAVSYICLVICASIYEGIARYKPEKEYKQITENSRVGRFLSCFSIPKNWYRLTMNTPKNADLQKLSAIQGIRFYNMICVIMAHSLMGNMSELVSNPKFVEGLTHNMENTIISNGGYVNQTYMLISSWLLTFQFLQMFEGKERVQWKHLKNAFIYRLIRVTPTYAFVLFLQATWLVHISNGPNWDPLVGVEHKNCRRNLWINLLYLNNLVDYKNMCMQHMWYLATDTQLFIFVLILLMFVINYPKKRNVILACFTIIGIILPGIITYIYNLDIILRFYPEKLYNLNVIKEDIFAYAYIYPLSNVGGYMIGIICGYLFYYYKDKQLFTNKIVLLFWWLISVGLPISSMLYASQAYNDDFNLTRLKAAVYWSLGKNIFAIGIAVFIFGMTQGAGWFPRRFCEWNAVRVYGRISYCAYIVHLAVVRVRVGAARYPIYQNKGLLVYSVIADVTSTYLYALVLCLFVEMPTSALQKLFIPQLNNKDKQKQLEKINSKYKRQ